MSAIAGIWNFDEKPDAAESCTRMLKSQQIYGPHEVRQWSDVSIAMGRRLYRTLPEDIHDHQPVQARDGDLTLVADVRLDNREELTSGLRLTQGSAGRHSDADLLLRSLERWGEGALDRIVGDFAFALWNAREQKLLLARDYLGQRPLHYHCSSRFFAFASMPKGLHALPQVPYALDMQHMAEFVALVPPDHSSSFFEEVRSVEAGTCVSIARNGLTKRRYWAPARGNRHRVASKDHAEELRFHLDQATRARLRGGHDGVGSHLSAGLDSAGVCATAARLLEPEGRKLVAFTSVPRAGYDGPVPPGRIGDEGPLAAATAAMYPNIEHVLVHGDRRSPLEELDRFFFLFDAPVLNPCNFTWLSAINTAARERKLAIMLNGQMGNFSVSYSGLELLPELLRRGRYAQLWREGSKLVRSGHLRWRGLLAAGIGPFTPFWLWQRVNELRSGKWDVLQYTAMRPDRLEALDLPGLARKRGWDLSFRPASDGFDMRLAALQRFDQGNYNKGTLAGWGIDQRDPTADRRVVEFCLRVPMAQFLCSGETRALARRTLSDRLPAAVLDERRKGYQASDWHEGLTVARDQVVAEIARLPSCAPAAGILDLARLKRLTEDWPKQGWHRPDILRSHRLALLRGLSAGHFMRKVSGANE